MLPSTRSAGSPLNATPRDALADRETRPLHTRAPPGNRAYRSGRSEFEVWNLRNARRKAYTYHAVQMLHELHLVEGLK